MESERNIASLLRSYQSFYNGGEGLGYVKESAINNMQNTYHLARSFKTKKGQWKMYEREAYAIPYFIDDDSKLPINVSLSDKLPPSSSICAVYERNEEPRAIFLGQLSNRKTIDAIAQELTDTILEQKGMFFKTPRKLTATDGYKFGGNRGIATLFGALLIPLAEMGIGIGSHYLNLGFHYDSTLAKVVNQYPMPSLLAVFGGVFALAGNISLQSNIYQKCGEKADKRRIRRLPQEASAYFYGAEAELSLRIENVIALEEQQIKNAYEDHDTSVSKQEFVKQFNEIKGFREKQKLILDWETNRLSSGWNQ
jgi:hypothetical protein